MAKYGSASITITLDDAPGGSPQAVTNYVLTMGGAKIENILQPSHAFGDAWEESLATGMARVPAITFTGFLDDTATSGPHVVFQVKTADRAAASATRTLAIAFGGGTFTVEGHMQSYEVLGKNGNLTEFAAVFQPSGAAAWT
jgi:hypothetical protein